MMWQIHCWQHNLVVVLLKSTIHEEEHDLHQPSCRKEIVDLANGQMWLILCKVLHGRQSVRLQDVGGCNKMW